MHQFERSFSTFREAQLALQHRLANIRKTLVFHLVKRAAHPFRRDGRKKALHPPARTDLLATGTLGCRRARMRFDRIGELGNPLAPDRCRAQDGRAQSPVYACTSWSHTGTKR